MPRHPDEARVRALALSFAETREDLPWGHSAIKVRGKTFVFLRQPARAARKAAPARKGRR